MKVSGVPHAEQNERNRPAHAITRGSPWMKRNSPHEMMPRDEGRAAASTTIRAMTVRDVVRLAGHLVTNRSAQTPP